jgi:antitoxin (DNA-binding transcriptional repressor) of toxin-antitoxin stability system
MFSMGLDLIPGQVYGFKMTKANLHEVKSRLAHYARLVKAGETVILCERNKPFAEIRPLGPVPPPPERQLGLMKGWFPVPDDFNDADPELEDAIANTPVFPRVNAPSTSASGQP